MLPPCICECPEADHMGLPRGCVKHGLHNYTASVPLLASEKQVGGSHYKTMAIQPWEVIARGELDFWEGNVVKYVMRYRAKNGLEDLEKARHHIDYLIEREKRNAERDF